MFEWLKSRRVTVRDMGNRNGSYTTRSSLAPATAECPLPAMPPRSTDSARPAALGRSRSFNVRSNLIIRAKQDAERRQISFGKKADLGAMRGQQVAHHRKAHAGATCFTPRCEERLEDAPLIAY